MRYHQHLLLSSGTKDWWAWNRRILESCRRTVCLRMVQKQRVRSKSWWVVKGSSLSTFLDGGSAVPPLTASPDGEECRRVDDPSFSRMGLRQAVGGTFVGDVNGFAGKLL